MKKIFIFLIAVFLCVCLIACSGNDDTTTTDGGSQTSTSTKDTLTTTTVLETPTTTITEAPTTTIVETPTSTIVETPTTTIVETPTTTVVETPTPTIVETPTTTIVETPTTTITETPTTSVEETPTTVPEDNTTTTAPEDSTTTTAPDDSTTTEKPDEPQKPAFSGIKYKLSNGGTYYIVSLVGNVDGGVVEIPASYNGLPVKEISNIAFNTKESGAYIKSISLPDSITELPEYAFHNCESVESIRLPNGIKSIPQNTFFNCKNLTELKIPDTVEFIDFNAFANCNKLKETVGNVKYVDNWAIEYEDRYSYSDIIFREGTVGIAKSCSNTEIVKIVLPDTLKYINATLKPSMESRDVVDGNEYLGNWLFSTRENEMDSDYDLVIREGTIGILPGAIKPYYNAYKLTFRSITIPASLKYIYSFTLAVNEINVAEGNPLYKSVDGVVYSKDGKTLLYYPRATLRTAPESFTVPPICGHRKV